jgi:ribose 1,5-bisphosphokinase PhnN
MSNSLMSFDNTTCPSLSYFQTLDLIQVSELVDRCPETLIDYSIPGNRLVQRNGSIEIIPKSPAFVLGEYIATLFSNIRRGVASFFSNNVQTESKTRLLSKDCESYGDNEELDGKKINGAAESDFDRIMRTAQAFSNTTVPFLTCSKSLQASEVSFYTRLSRIPSVVVTDNVCKITHIFGIRQLAIIGPSASGKTFLIQGIRERIEADPDYAKQLEIPKRFTTRPSRQGEDVDENEYLTEEEFSQKGLAWSCSTFLGKNRRVSYGFAETDSKRVAIYPATNCFLDKKVLKDVFIICVYVPDNIRRQRLLKRLAYVSQEEIEYRLSDSFDRIAPFCDLIVENYGVHERDAKVAIASVIENFVELAAMSRREESLEKHLHSV